MDTSELMAQWWAAVRATIDAEDEVARLDAYGRMVTGSDHPNPHRLGETYATGHGWGGARSVALQLSILHSTKQWTLFHTMRAHPARVVPELARVLAARSAATEEESRLRDTATSTVRRDARRLYFSQAHEDAVNVARHDWEAFVRRCGDVPPWECERDSHSV